MTADGTFYGLRNSSFELAHDLEHVDAGIYRGSELNYGFQGIIQKVNGFTTPLTTTSTAWNYSGGFLGDDAPRHIYNGDFSKIDPQFNMRQFRQARTAGSFIKQGFRDSNP